MRKTRTVKSIVASLTKMRTELEEAIQEDRSIIAEKGSLVDSVTAKANEKLASITHKFAEKEKALRTKRFNEFEKVNSKKTKVIETANADIDDAANNISEALEWLEVIPTPKSK